MNLKVVLVVQLVFTCFTTNIFANDLLSKCFYNSQNSVDNPQSLFCFDEGNSYQKINIERQPYFSTDTIFVGIKIVKGTFSYSSGNIYLNPHLEGNLYNEEGLTSNWKNEIDLKSTNIEDEKVQFIDGNIMIDDDGDIYKYMILNRIPSYIVNEINFFWSIS